VHAPAHASPSLPTPPHLTPSAPRKLKDNRFWNFVIDNAPWSVYYAYRNTLYGLVERALAMIKQVGGYRVWRGAGCRVQGSGFSGVWAPHSRPSART
jgi:hypothetical protein